MDRPATTYSAHERGDQCFRSKRLGSSEEERLRRDQRKLDELQLRRLPRQRPGTLLRGQSLGRSSKGKGPRPSRSETGARIREIINQEGRISLPAEFETVS